MIFEVLTLFPQIFEAYVHAGILRKAQEKSLISFNIFNLRDFAHDRHKQVDDYPYGGGAGMVLKTEPLIEAIEHIKRGNIKKKVILLSPQGVPYSQKMAEQLKDAGEALLFVCGRYEGIDERVKCIIDDEISVGDYILTGGELPALVIIDSIVRLMPGVLGSVDSPVEESFSWGILDYPHYTRPRRFRGMGVPDVLLSGNHRDIWLWRRKQALKNTLLKRPDLLEKVPLNSDDYKILDEIKEEQKNAQDKGN